MAAYCAESIRTAVASQDAGCDERDALGALLYARFTCEDLLAAVKRSEGEPIADVKARRLLLRQFSEMGELRQNGDGAYFPASTRQVHFAGNVYLILGTIPQTVLARGGYSVSYSGSARYSGSPHASAVTLPAQGWLQFRSLDDAWLDACIKHYSALMLPTDIGAFDGLDVAILSSDPKAGAWAALDRYCGGTTALLRVRLANSYDYRLASLSLAKRPRILKTVTLDRDHARQFECAYLARSGRPKRLWVTVEGDQLRFRVPRMPILQRTALRHISHEEDMDNGTWRVARAPMLSVVEHVARSSRIEVVLK